MKVEKKILPEHFKDIISGKKKFELRLNDFDINEGDTLILKEHDGEKYTGREISKNVTHIDKVKIDKLYWTEEEIKEKGLQIISFE